MLGGDQAYKGDRYLTEETFSELLAMLCPEQNPREGLRHAEGAPSVRGDETYPCACLEE